MPYLDLRTVNQRLLELDDDSEADDSKQMDMELEHSAYSFAEPDLDCATADRMAVDSDEPEVEAASVAAEEEELAQDLSYSKPG